MNEWDRNIKVSRIALGVVAVISFVVVLVLMRAPAWGEKSERATADKPGIQVDIGEDRITLLCRCEQVKR